MRLFGMALFPFISQTSSEICRNKIGMAFSTFNIKIGISCFFFTSKLEYPVSFLYQNLNAFGQKNNPLPAALPGCESSCLFLSSFLP